MFLSLQEWSTFAELRLPHINIVLSLNWCREKHLCHLKFFLTIFIDTPGYQVRDTKNRGPCLDVPVQELLEAAWMSERLPWLLGQQELCAAEWGGTGRWPLASVLPGALPVVGLGQRKTTKSHFAGQGWGWRQLVIFVPTEFTVWGNGHSCESLPVATRVTEQWALSRELLLHHGQQGRRHAPLGVGAGCWEQGFGRVLLEDALYFVKIVPLTELPLILTACFISYQRGEILRQEW